MSWCEVRSSALSEIFWPFPPPRDEPKPFELRGQAFSACMILETIEAFCLRTEVYHMAQTFSKWASFLFLLQWPMEISFYQTTHILWFKCPWYSNCISDTSHHGNLILHPVSLDHRSYLFSLATCARMQHNQDIFILFVSDAPQQHFLNSFHIKNGSDRPVVQLSTLPQIIAPKTLVYAKFTELGANLVQQTGTSQFFQVITLRITGRQCC